MNLHAAVRSSITTVNPDIAATYRRSTGNTPDGAGNQSPVYAPAVPVSVQVQPLTGRQLEHADFMGLQGVLRAVYLYGLGDAVVRPLQLGGDVLTFDQGHGVQTWLVVACDEQWPDWARLTVALQQ